MMYGYRCLILFVLVDISLGYEAEFDGTWSLWKQLHRKVYNGAEEDRRRQIWETNVKRIQVHNLQYDLGEKTFSIGVNQFSDMHWEEIKQTVLLNRKEVSKIYSSTVRVGNTKLPEAIDWRTVGNTVTRVKNQLGCRASWAFAATGALEGQFNKRYGMYMELSEQQLVDCTRSVGNTGCHDGSTDHTFNYIADEGIESSSDYPYQALEQPCHHDIDKSVTYLHVTEYAAGGNETLLMELVAEDGPAASTIDVNWDFLHYKNGVFNSPSCSRTSVNHAVLVVGYGIEDDHEYWIVKNSWSPLWGEQGYFRIARNMDNMCGIATLGIIPLLSVDA